MSDPLWLDPVEPASHVAWIQAVLDDPDADVILRLPVRDGGDRWSGDRPPPDGTAVPSRPAAVSDGDSAWVMRLQTLYARMCTADKGGQDFYEQMHEAVFAELDALDAHLSERRWLQGGDAPTAADWWALAVLWRFDLAFHGFYKLSRNRVQDMAQLGPYVRDCIQHHPAIEGTLVPDLIVKHHAWAEGGRNPKRLVPRGGVPDWRVPHDRWRFDDEADFSAGADEDDRASRVRGEWVRPSSGHRDRITADGRSGFAAEPGRYHIYVANNCPWSHRVVLTRSLLGLTDAITLDTLYWRRDPDRGWQFRPEAPGCTPDTVHGNRYLVELYERLGSDEGSVPVLYDRQTDTIVNNESSEIIVMLDRAFRDRVPDDAPELYPSALQAEIDHLNAYTWREVNNGAYKAGFTSSQEAHDHWGERVFAALAWLDRRLEGRRWLVGDQLTLADVRLFPTIFRFDPVYFVRFRLNRRRVAEHDHLHAWLERMWAIPEVQRASNLQHCLNGYFGRTGNELVPPPPPGSVGA